MWGARQDCAAVRAVGDGVGRDRPHVADRGHEALVLLIGETEVGGVGIGEVREHPRDLDVGRVLGERAEEVGKLVGPHAEPSHSGIDLHVHARPSARVRRGLGGGGDALVVVDRTLDTRRDQRLVATGIAAPDDQHGHTERRHVERFGGRRDAEPRGTTGDRGFGGDVQPVAVAVRLHHRHHGDVAADVLDQRGRVRTDRRHVDLDPLPRRELARPRQACAPIRTASARPTGPTGCRPHRRARFRRRPRGWWRTPRRRCRWRR